MDLFLKTYIIGLSVISTTAFYPGSNINKDWWENAVFYQIYPRSFMDSNGDGVGDLKGITSKLEHLKESGVDATWLSPIFESPMVDFGYDISNFKQIHHEYGTMYDFEELLVKAKQLGIKIILDFVPNHSSDQCEWFIKSSNKVPGYDDYYIWHDGLKNPIEGGKPLLPNNWLSVFGKSAWSWSDKRKQYYFHQFTKEQPDMNYRNPRVVKEMEEILYFWLDKGVDGFRIDAVNHIYESVDLLDEPRSGKLVDPDDYEYLNHYHTQNLQENFDLIYSWRNLLDEYSIKHGGNTRIMMTEAYANISFTMKFYGSEDRTRKGSHMPFNFLLITDLDSNSNANDFVFTINKWLNYLPQGANPNWVMGNHDRHRVGSTFGLERIDCMNMLLLTLPGIAVTYYGEEIGMLNHPNIPWEETQDPLVRNVGKLNFQELSRDPVRSPFEWDDTNHAGFSTGTKTWIPVHPNYLHNNLKLQKSVKRSHYNLYKDLIELRKQKVYTHGSYRSLAINNGVFTFSREKDNEKYITIINLSNFIQVINLEIFEIEAEYMAVILSGSKSKYKKGDYVQTKSIALGPYESLILTPYSDKININNYPSSTWSVVKNTAIAGIVLSLAYNNFSNLITRTKFK